MTIPTSPAFVDGGIPIYWIEGVKWFDRRPTPGDIRAVCIHHTNGSDSREYLRHPHDGRRVSAHYLVGAYADTGNEPRVYKYLTEGTGRAWTQGGGRLGGYKENPNNYSVSVEIEGPPFRGDVLALAAQLTAVILRRYPNVLLVRHRDMDANKVDPSFMWGSFCKQVYEHL